MVYKLVLSNGFKKDYKLNNYKRLQISFMSFSRRLKSSSSKETPKRGLKFVFTFSGLPRSSNNFDEGIPNITAILSTISGCGQLSLFSI